MYTATIANSFQISLQKLKNHFHTFHKAIHNFTQQQISVILRSTKSYTATNVLVMKHKQLYDIKVTSNFNKYKNVSS